MKKIQCLLLLFLFACGSVFAQKNVITGKVINKETGQPMQGVNIVADKSKTGTVTNADGTYSFKVKAGSKLLVFSNIGFTAQTIIIDGKTVIDVALVIAAIDNAEVVVVGYGTQKRSNVTGAVSKYKNKKLSQSPFSRIDQAIQGKIAGVQVQNTSSEAGAPPKINIRGISTINAGASPLVIVDGQPVPDGLAFVNMADIESVEVLKDAASAAIYGSRGASGVIIITTKSGKASEVTKYNFTYSIGSKKAYKRYSTMTSTEYVNMLFYEAALKSTDTSIVAPTGNNIASANERAAYLIEQNFLGGKGTDWQSEALRTGLVQNIQLNATGGKKDVKYFISGGYQGDKGMLYNGNNEKFNLRTKFDMQLSKRVKLTLNLNPSYTKKESPSQNFTNFVRFQSAIPLYHNEATAQFVNQTPQYADIRSGDFAQPRQFNSQSYTGTMPDGSLWATSSLAEPFGSSQNTPKSSLLTHRITSNEYRLQSSLDLTVNLLPGLDFKSLASTYVNYTKGLNYTNRNSDADGVVSKGVYQNNTLIDLLSENTFTYTKNIKDHTISALIGYTIQRTNVNTDQTTGLDYPSDNIRTLNNATQIDKAGTFGTRNQIGLQSYLGRVNYAYKNKYLLSTSFRADGSSYFGTGHKWGTFPSVSVGWNATKEKFLQNINWLSNLKIRGSYGVSGNNRILDFGFLNLLYPANYPLGPGTGNTTAGQASSTTIIANKDITWESTFQSNFGADISLFKNRVSLTVDVYQSKTDRLLLQQSAMAFTGAPLYWNNIGSLKNTGVELELSTINIENKNFKWSTSANFSRTRNKVVELGNEAFLLNQGERTEVYRNKVGDPLVQFFGFKTDGVWLSQADIDAAKAKGLSSDLNNVFVPGGLKLVDVNGDNKIDNNDRTVIGSPYPDFTWGITNSIEYGAFDLSFTFQGVQGGSLVNGDPNYVEIKRYNRAYNTNRWLSPKFPGDGKTPYSSNGFNWMLTDYVVEDASFYSLQDVNIGYTLPVEIASRFKINSMRLFFSAQNLYFHTAKSYRGINPEARTDNGAYGSSLLDGYQRGGFPVPKTLLFGIDINF